MVVMYEKEQNIIKKAGVWNTTHLYKSTVNVVVTVFLEQQWLSPVGGPYGTTVLACRD